jgi:hypothetical protein
MDMSISMRSISGLIGAAFFIPACSRSPGVAQPAPAPSASHAAPALPDVPPLPTARHGHRAEVIGETVFVMGGYARQAGLPHDGAAETWSCNPAAGYWRKRADMPTARTFFASAVLDATILAIGDSLDAYDPETDRWEILAGAESFPRSHFAAALVGRRVYVLGGFPAVMGGFLAFDVDSRRRIDLPEPPGFARGDHFHILASLDGTLHLFGGITYEKFDTTPNHFIFDGERWSSAAPSPVPLWAKFSACQVVGSSLFVFGDAGALRYDAAAERWSNVAPMDGILVMPASVAAAGRLYVIGGMLVKDDSKSRGDVWTYDVVKDAW